MKVVVNVSRTKAILDGKNLCGLQTVEVDPGQLSAEERVALAKCSVGCIDAHGYWENHYDGGCLRLESSLEISEATVETVRACLAHKARELAAKKTKEAEEAKKRAERIEATAAAIIAKVPEDVGKLGHISNLPDKWPYGDYWEIPAQGAYDIREEVMARPEVVEWFNRARRHYDAENEKLAEAYRLQKEQDARESRERQAIKEAADAEISAKRQAQIAEWVETHGDQNQRERYAADVLPEDEVIEAMRNEAFAPLESVERYEKITNKDVDCDCEYDHCGVDYEVDEMEKMSALQWAEQKRIQSLMPEGTKVTLRRHVGERERCHIKEVRYSFLVAVKVGEFDFSRAYAAPYPQEVAETPEPDDDSDDNAE